MNIKEKDIIDSWQKVSVAAYDRIVEIQREHPTDCARYIIEELYDIDDAEALPLHEYAGLVAALRAFSEEPVAESRLTGTATYTINGRVYEVDCTPSAFTAGQYIDFTNYVKNGSRLQDLLSVVVLPQGHTYGDGYDMQQAREDIGALPCTVGFAVVRFFALWLKRFTATSLRFLTSKRIVKKGKIAEKKVEEMKGLLDDLQATTASCPIFSPTAASRTRR
jgi:hypothetical protein